MLHFLSAVLDNVLEGHKYLSMKMFIHFLKVNLHSNLLYLKCNEGIHCVNFTFSNCKGVGTELN